MKIVEKEELKQCLISNIEIGECFNHDTEYYIKTDKIYTSSEGIPNSICVNLKDGTTKKFFYYNTCKKINAKLVIE